MQEKKYQPGQGDMGRPREEALMQQKDLPKRPGEYGPDDASKKGGAPLKNPGIEGPTDIPDKGSDVRHPPA